MIGILGNFNKDEFYAIFNELGGFLKEENLEFYLLESKQIDLSRILHKEVVSDFETIVKKTKIIISIGGDGTIISTIRKLIGHEKPILGLHIGGLGFLAESNIDNYKTKILNILNNDYYIEKRMLLKVLYTNKNTRYDVINELVVDRGYSGRTIRTSVEVSGQYVNTYESDGIIFSTPTGSTAYSLSAGGPIVHSKLDLIVITPICPHTLSMRPLIVSSDEEIKVTFDTSDKANKELSLTIDGQIQESIDNDSMISIKKSNHFANMIKFKDDNYYSTLRKKMNWKGDLRYK